MQAIYNNPKNFISALIASLNMGVKEFDLSHKQDQVQAEIQSQISSAPYNTILLQIDDESAYLLYPNAEQRNASDSELETLVLDSAAKMLRSNNYLVNTEEELSENFIENVFSEAQDQIDEEFVVDLIYGHLDWQYTITIGSAMTDVWWVDNTAIEKTIKSIKC